MSTLGILYETGYTLAVDRAAMTFCACRRGGVHIRATLTQSFIFFGFSAFWTILAFFLGSSRFNLGADVVGAFGILALIGVPIAPYSIRALRRYGMNTAILFGALLFACSFLIMAYMATLAGLAVGVVLMITGLQIALIGNQTVVFQAAGSARGRFNTVFMAGQFTFGALGSAAASWAWSTGGWTAVMIMSAISAALSLIVQLIPTTPRAN